LLGHIPALIGELAAFFRAPAYESIAANAVVTARATELGRLRHSQRASVHQVLREYRLLRGVIAQFIDEEMTRLQLMPATGRSGNSSRSRDRPKVPTVRSFNGSTLQR
jgi:hypothetical protein